MDSSGSGLWDDDLLRAVISRLSLRERHGVVALVCRRWRDVVLSSPQLLANVVVEISSPAAQVALARLRSLEQWLALRAQGHVQRLSLAVAVRQPAWLAAVVHGGSDNVDHLAAQAVHMDVLHIVVAAVGAVAGGLTQLRLELQGLPLLQLGPWITELRRLQALHIQTSWSDGVALTASLAPLAALRDLRLCSRDGVPLDLGNPEHVTLPPGLTRLHLESANVMDRCPTQVFELRALRHLVLSRVAADGEELAPLSRLAALETLELYCMQAIDTYQLVDLPALRRLTVAGSPWFADDADEILAEVDAVLAPLTQLTRLDLLGCDLPSLPPALTGLAALRRLHIDEDTQLKLPLGAWLAGLRQTVLPLGMAAANSHALSVATHLEALGLLHSSSTCLPKLPRLLHWAAQQAALRRLVLGWPTTADPTRAVAAQLRLPKQLTRMLHPPVALSMCADDGVPDCVFVDAEGSAIAEAVVGSTMAALSI